MTEPTKPATEIPLDAIDGGVVVGIGIASGFLGLLLGLLSFAAWYLCVPRNDQSLRAFSCGFVGHRIRDEEVVNDSRRSTEGGRLDRYLLRGASDDSIAFRLTTMAELISVHSQVHYNLDPKNTDLEVLTTALLHLGMGEAAAADLEKLALEPSTRRLAIRHVICWAIFYNLDVHSIGPFSLLPPPVLEFLRSAAQYWSSMGTTLESRLALNTWRRLSAFLLHSHRQDKTPLRPSHDKVRTDIKALANALDEFLKHFAAANSPGRRLAHLEEIIFEATKFGYLLFSHPCEWALKLDVSSLENAVMVAPGLERHSDYRGEILEKVHPVVQLKTAVLGERLGVEGGIGALSEE